MTDTTDTSAPGPHRSARDRLRIEAYLTRVDWHLEAVLPGKDRRSIVKELRQALTSDPRDVTASIRDLGAPKTLAEQYGDDGRRKPLWSIGVIAAGTALLVYWTVFLSYVFGMLAAVESTGSTEAAATFFTIDVTAFSSADGVGIGWTSTWAWLVVPAAIAVMALLLGARSWRALNPSLDRA